MNLNSPKFKVGDIVQLKGCPFDEQISEELAEYNFLKDKKQTVTEIQRVCKKLGTSGQWIKTDFMTDWTDKAWFKLIKKNIGVKNK